MGKFELVVEDVTDKLGVVKILYNGIDIYSEIFEKDEEKKKLLEEWKKFVENSDGAIKTIVSDESGYTYTSIVFLKTLKDTDKYRYYKYSLNVAIEGYMVFDKENGQMILLTEDPSALEDQVIDQLIEQGKGMVIPVLFVYK